jgi:hypothetical protein
LRIILALLVAVGVMLAAAVGVWMEEGEPVPGLTV